MHKETIVYLGGFELPDKNAAAHRVLNNAKIFRELGYNVIFISVDKTLPYNTDVLGTRDLIQGFDTWFVPYPTTNSQWIDYLINIKAFLKVIEHYNNVRKVICYNYQALALMKVRRYCNKRNIKVIADCTEWPDTKGSNLLFKIIKEIDTFFRMRVIQKKLDGLIVISKYLERYYRGCKNVTRIPPLVDMSDEKWNLSDINCDDGIIRFVYAGSPGKNKDKLNVVIESLAKLKNFTNYQFCIIGLTKEQYLENHEQHKGILDNNQNIKFLGRLPHLESISYVKRADFSIFIRDETRTTMAGFPTKFVESITARTGVITTRNSDLKEYLTEGRNGYFVSDDDMVSKLEEISHLSREQINSMKECHKSYNPFDYQCYISSVSRFLSAI